MKRVVGIRDNKGVTLLEVIIALAIFSVVALVLLDGFYAAGRANKKSATYQKATVLGQNILEGFKSRSLEELSREFNYPWDVQNDDIRFSLLTVTDDLKNGIQAGWNGSSDGVLIREVNGRGKQPAGFSSIISTDSGKTWQFAKQSTGQYYFQMHNVPVGKQRFDATITVDGVNSVTDDDGGGSDKAYKDSSSAAKPNNYGNPLLDNMDIFQDAIFMAGDYSQAGSVDHTALTTMIKKKDDYLTANPSARIPAVDLDTLGKDMERDIKFIISKTGGSTKVAVDYKVNSPLLKAYCPVNANAHNGMGECFCTYRNENTFFDNAETSQDLRSLYLVYSPNYESVSPGTAAKDRIVVHNPENVDVTFHLIKQKMLLLSEDQLKEAEKKYKVNVTIEETPKANWNTLASRHRGTTKIRTNVNSNIAYNTQEERDANPNAKTQMFLTYRAVNSNRYVNSSAGSSAAVFSITQMKNLQSKEQKFRLYSIHISIYEPGTLAAGEPNTWKSKKIATFDGAKEN